MDITSLKTLLHSGKTLTAAANRHIFRLYGPDAQSFLQRMSTNDMNKLSPKNPIGTCFLSDKGRMIDFALIFAEGPEQYLVASSFFDRKLYLWLEKYHFVEDLVLEDVSHVFHSSIVIANDAPTLDDHSYAFLLSALPAKLGSPSSLWLQVSKTSAEITLNDQWWQILRIACGIPDPAAEINEAFMPQNIGLSYTIASNKGCYVGQEVIAKALTYQKNVKALAQLELSMDEFDHLHDDKKIKDALGHLGIITSLAPHYVKDLPQALAVADKKASTASNLSYKTLASQFIFLDL